MEEMKKSSLGFEVLLLALFACMLAAAASARDPFVGLPVGGKRLRDSELDCCNECKCNADMTSCVCQDGLPRGCTVGCQSCHRDHGRYYCQDVLDGCPESCDYDYDGDGPGPQLVRWPASWEEGSDRDQPQHRMI